METLERRAGPQDREQSMSLVEFIAYMSKGKKTLRAVSGFTVKDAVGSQLTGLKSPSPMTQSLAFLAEGRSDLCLLSI